MAFYKSKIGSNGVTNWREVATASHYWSKSPATVRRYRGGNPWNGSKRWIESTTATGLRYVGDAHDIAKLRHNGWYTDHFQSETYEGAVWQLPARNGAEQFVAGYLDPNNSGAAFIDFAITSDKVEAATWGDRIAEIAAEDQREFAAKELAEQDIFNAREEIHDNNRDALKLIKEIKLAGKFTPAICGALKAELQRMWSYRAKQFELITKRESDFWSAVEV